LIWRSVMSAVTAKIYREKLFWVIFDILRQWSELERSVFARVHYHGQSPKTIALSLELDVADVRAILRQCEHRLYASLREFRKISGEKPLHIHAETVASDARRQNFRSGHGIPCKSCKNPGISRVAFLSF
jgi:hypothetical protein